MDKLIIRINGSAIESMVSFNMVDIEILSQPVALQGANVCKIAIISSRHIKKLIRELETESCVASMGVRNECLVYQPRVDH